MDKAELLRISGLSRFIALDFETTGLNPADDRVIEVSAVRFINGLPGDTFTSLVNPHRRLSPLIIDLTGITDEMLAKAPEEKKIAPELLAFLGDDPIVAHNLSFDLSFLKGLAKRHDLGKIKNDLYDTLFLARIFLFNESSFSLGSLSESFGFEMRDAHRAYDDAVNCGNLLVKLVEIAAGFPLSVISQILEVINPFEIFNKSLFTALGTALLKKGESRKGLVPEHDYGVLPGNYFESDEQNDPARMNPSDVFGQKGFLSKSKDGFEFRSEQVSFSEFAMETFYNGSSIGIAEAGTGLGKSMAYLFPAIHRAQSTGNPVIISCHTKHLQDQLFHNDLPQLVESAGIPTKTTLLKGRSNYICRTRFTWLIGNANKILSSQEAGKLIALIPWLSLTRTGDLSECNGFWNSFPGRLTTLVQSEPGYCTTPQCQSHHGCYFGRVRKRVFSSDLIIVNHALLLSQAEGEGILPHYDTVIVDEGHNLVNVAYNQYAAGLDLRTVLNNIKRMNPEDPYNSRMMNILNDLARKLPELKDSTGRLSALSREIESAADRFFKVLYQDFQVKYSYKSRYTRKVIMENLAEAYGDHLAELHSFMTNLEKLVSMGENLKNRILALDPGKETYGEFIRSLEYRIDIIAGLILTLSVISADQKKDWVYWQECATREVPENKTGYLISLHASPVDISSVLVSEFFNNIEHCLISSATIRVDDSFNYFLSRTGIDTLSDRKILTEIFPSPFQYEDQVTYLQYAGELSVSENPDAIADFVYRLYRKKDHRIMVLFTARSTLENVYRALRQKPEGRDLPLFAQVRNSSRFALVQGMKKAERGILLGTNAFWEGIDFPGDLLETLVITKLPFDVPTEPIVQSFSQLISMKGGNAFRDFSIPECVIRFRQGFGRLIRTTLDQGTFIVLDNRIVTKQYGHHLSDAIPVRQELFTDL